MVHDRSVAIGHELSAPIVERDLEPVINPVFCGTPPAVDAIERNSTNLLSDQFSDTRQRVASETGARHKSPLDAPLPDRMGGGVRRGRRKGCRPRRINRH